METIHAMDGARCISDRHDVVVRITNSHQSFLHPLSNLCTFGHLLDEIRNRFKLSSSQKLSTVYNIPGSIRCLLQSDNDLEMLIFAAKNYKLDIVDVVVTREKVKLVNGVRSKHFDLNLPCEEDAYLGEPFRTNVPTSYLSDEWSTYIVGVGQSFNGGAVQFREKMKKYAIQKGFFYFYYRNDPVYIAVDCEDVECAFFVKGSVDSTDDCFYIDACELNHTCNCVLRKNIHGRLDSEIVAQCMLNDVKYHPSIRPREIIRKFKINYGFDIGYKVALNARSKALVKIYGKDYDSFNKLRWYTEAVERTNPGSYVDLEVDEVSKRFRRMFIAYGGCVAGFAHCIPVLFVDGCFRKSMYKGQILAATSKNADKGIFPLAISVCNSENEDNWAYFFTHLKKIIEMLSRTVTFVSDRGVGLLAAFNKIFPGFPHLYCYYHLQQNLKLRITGKGSSAKAKKVSKRFFKCAYSSTKKEYFHNLKSLRETAGHRLIDDFLRDLPLEHWCRAFAVGCRYGIMENTIAESFNSWIALERGMPVYSMFESVRVKQMAMLSERSTEAEQWFTTLPPSIEKDLAKHIKLGSSYQVIKAFRGLYEVRDVFSYEVDLNELKCSCVKWQINSFPCPHACSAILASKQDICTFIDPVYTTQSYRDAYSYPINPVSNVDETYFETDDDFIHPPEVRVQAGRPKKKRYRSVAENPSRKSIVCSRCKVKGSHNKTTCRAPI